MKKILIVCGSPRVNGNSDLLAAQFAKGAQEAGHKVQTVYVRQLKMNYCHGCMACLPDALSCVQHDDVNALLPWMMDADVICFCTPVYYYSITAQMKTFLDRMNPLYGHLRDKEVYYMVTAAEESHQQLDRAMDALQGFVDCFDGMVVKGRIYGGGATDKGDIVKLPAYQEAYEMGRNI